MVIESLGNGFPYIVSLAPHSITTIRQRREMYRDVPNIILLEMWSTETRAASSDPEATVFYCSVGK